MKRHCWFCVSTRYQCSDQALSTTAQWAVHFFNTKQRNLRNKRTFFQWKTFQIFDSLKHFRIFRCFVCFVKKQRTDCAVELRSRARISCSKNLYCPGFEVYYVDTVIKTPLSCTISTVCGSAAKITLVQSHLNDVRFQTEKQANWVWWAVSKPCVLCVKSLWTLC